MNALLLHDEMLSPTHPLLEQFADLPRIFIFDTATQAHGGWALKRLQFVADCLAEIPDVQIYQGDTAAVLRALNIARVVTQTTPQRWLVTSLSGFAVQWCAEPAFASYEGPLKRFTPYWKRVESQLIRA
jgi:deoxyribodipyrimidine photo-lyase